MRFKAKKGSFSEPKFLPRWQISFFGYIGLRIDGLDPESHLDFVKYFEKNISNFENKLGENYGKWSVFYKDGVIRKEIIFSANGKILPKDWNIKFEDEGPFFAKNDEIRKKAIEWSCHCIPVFEKLIIEYSEKYILENPGSVESPIGYGG